MAYNEHMRLDAPERQTSVEELARSPQSIARPVGWRSLMELGPYEGTIATNCLSRCPHCQTHSGVSLPLGIDGSVDGCPTLLADPELREFPIEKLRIKSSSGDAGPAAHSAWIYEGGNPPLDTPPQSNTGHSRLLADYVSATPPENNIFNLEQWSNIVSLGEVYL